MRNTTEESAVIETDGVTALVNVQSVTVDESADPATVTVTSMGLPNYTVTFTQAQVDALNARPLASTDFATGSTTAIAGTTYDWGADIGFNSTGCRRDGADEGDGWWPPGPECPEASERSMTIPVSPTPATETCWTPLGTAGLMVNGVAMFNWTDSFTYDNEGVWYNLAQKLEIYDLGVCAGHAAGGNYHHHLDAPCLEDQLGDTGDGHSPVYGFAPDGVPLYGPWVADGVRAQSCWATRDYSEDGGVGCDGVGERSCVLVDPHDPTQGAVTATANGPTTSESVTSLSGNSFTATSGFYFEDYYFDSTCAAAGGAFLDQHNGHDHDDLGYHYHMTDGFPYSFGPTYYGELADDNGITTCQDTPYPATGGGMGAR
jgi:hypothetical protein